MEGEVRSWGWELSRRYGGSRWAPASPVQVPISIHRTAGFSSSPRLLSQLPPCMDVRPSSSPLLCSLAASSHCLDLLCIPLPVLGGHALIGEVLFSALARSQYSRYQQLMHAQADISWTEIGGRLRPGIDKIYILTFKTIHSSYLWFYYKQFWTRFCLFFFIYFWHNLWKIIVIHRKKITK